MTTCDQCCDQLFHCSETEKLGKKDPRRSAATYDGLVMNISTYPAFLSALLFRPKNTHFCGVWIICGVMKCLEGSTHHFHGCYCRRITWALIVGMHHVFNQLLMPDDFQCINIDAIPFPTTLLEDIAKDIRKSKEVESMDLPPTLVRRQ